MVSLQPQIKITRPLKSATIPQSTTRKIWRKIERAGLGKIFRGNTPKFSEYEYFIRLAKNKRINQKIVTRALNNLGLARSNPIIKEKRKQIQLAFHDFLNAPPFLADFSSEVLKQRLTEQLGEKGAQLFFEEYSIISQVTMENTQKLQGLQ